MTNDASIATNGEPGKKASIRKKPAYRQAITALVDLAASTPFDVLIGDQFPHCVHDDLDTAFERRHRKTYYAFAVALNTDYEQRRAERRKAGAGKAAATRAASRARVQQ
jgi:hypothetical protein